MGTKISALPAASSALVTQELPVNQGGTSKKLTVGKILGKAATAPTGSEASPYLAATITLPITADLRQVKFLQGDGAPLVLAGTPRIANGSTIGQELILIGTDDTNTLEVPGTGAGLRMNGPCVLRQGSSIGFIWTGTTWTETFRNDK